MPRADQATFADQAMFGAIVDENGRATRDHSRSGGVGLSPSRVGAASREACLVSAWSRSVVLRGVLTGIISGFDVGRDLLGVHWHGVVAELVLVIEA